MPVARRAASAWQSESDERNDLFQPSSTRTSRFPNSARIRDSKSFVRLLQGRKRIDGCVEMSFARKGEMGARLGIVVSSRFLPRAVDRNAFKRIVREAFRAKRAELPDGDVLIRLRQSLKAREPVEWRKEVSGSVESLLASIGS